MPKKKPKLERVMRQSDTDYDKWKAFFDEFGIGYGERQTWEV